jgi:hypothetical protein
MGAAPYTALRGMGRIETAMALSHRMLRGTGQAVVTLTLGGAAGCGPALLRRACAHVHRAYALLRCAVPARGKAPWLAGGVPFAAVDTVWRPTPQSLDEFARTVLNAPQLCAERALWRLEAAPALQDGELHVALVCHHAVVDASGVAHIIGTLLGALECLLDGREPPVLDGAEGAAALDDLLDPAALEAVAARPAPPLAGREDGWPAIERRTTAFETVRVAPGVLERATARCGAGASALLAAAYAQACVQAGVAPARVPLRYALSLRDALVPRPDDALLGCYIDVGTAHLDTTAAGTAALARDFGRQFTQAMLASGFRRQPFSAAGMAAALAAGERAGAFAPGVGLTHIGAFPQPPGLRRLRVLAYLPLARRLAAANRCVLHAYSFDGVQGLTLVYPEPNFSRQAAQRVLAALAARLAEAGEEQAA